MKYFFTVLCFILSLSTVSAQSGNGAVEGKLISEAGKPVARASVYLKGTSHGTETSENGTFSLKAPSGSYTLIAKTLGNQGKQSLIEITSGETLRVADIVLTEAALSLNEMVVTGQSEPQSLRNSVYQVRTIDSEKIKLRGATNLQTILNTELGIRFSNDLTLGTTDIQLMGMTGQSVKILLDGIPVVDRGSVRESLGQIDVNTIERIEIVEGPMSVIYGTDALAGVINIITKKGDSGSNVTVNARIQEETAGDEYDPLTKRGIHNQSLGLTWQKNHWQLTGNITRNNFGGWQGSSNGRAKDWMPKEQMLYTAGLGYQGNKWNIWYRFNGTDETIQYLGNRNPISGIAADKEYNTYRWFHQLQSQLNVSEKLRLTGVMSYTDYSRKTLSTNIDASGRRTLSLDPGSQDKSIFATTFFPRHCLLQILRSLCISSGRGLFR
jgi:outer membrane receptor for ferrienterochelin and colicins